MPSERKLQKIIEKYLAKSHKKKRRSRTRTRGRNTEKLSTPSSSPHRRRHRRRSSYTSSRSRSPVRCRRSPDRRRRSPSGHRRTSDDSRASSSLRRRQPMSPSCSRSRSPVRLSRSPLPRPFQQDNVNEDVTCQSKREEEVPAENQIEDEPSAPTQTTDIPASGTSASVPPTIGVLDNLPAVETSDYLEALGEEYGEPSAFEGTIHEGVSKRWSHILTNGLKKEEREVITKKYKFPSNCTLLDAPLLNEEVKTVMTESSKLRDRGLEIGQKQLGLALSIIGTAMTKIMTEPDNINKIEIISILSEGTKLIADSLYHQTRTRIKLITPALDKNFNQIIEKAKRDTHLFGNNVSEKIKNAKQLQQSVAHIKKPAPKTSTKTTGKNQMNQGNKAGPPFNKATTSGGPRANKQSLSRRPPAAPKQQRPERTYQYQAHRSAPPRR